ncbi:hypothetical protein [Clostridium drakei]|uniref:Uncharacterized protein n=1 Tax=Clostridium drakei TaxID=332101 RepID=A0A2U8DN29_9CLOT|nr:hypothetical protein [Clostridium drakei]AWI04146.1 hypothetical protein B9W14_06430 [Clostridium drakei]
MSRFFKMSNTPLDGSAVIDDGNISTQTTYSSYEINELINKYLAPQFKEYPSDIRASPQKIFETPDSSKGIEMWVLREGVKMSKNADYTVLDNTHISFVEDVSEKYSVTILVFGGGNTSGGTTPTLSSDEPSIYVQSTPIITWSINHKKNFQYPKLDIVDNSNHRITDSVDIHYEDSDNLTISSEISFMGKCIIY